MFYFGVVFLVVLGPPMSSMILFFCVSKCIASKGRSFVTFLACYHFFFSFANFLCCSFIVVSCNENFCYYLLKSRRHWLTAQEECRTFYAHLVSIHSASENEYIANTILREENIDEVHLGKINHSKDVL